MSVHPFERWIYDTMAKQSAELNRNREAATRDHAERMATAEAASRANNDWLREFHTRTSPTFEAHLIEARKARGLE